MKSTHAAMLLVSTLAFGPGPAQAQIYRWVDEKGVTHYEEKPGAKSARPVDLADPTGGPKPAEPAPATTRTIIHPDGTTVTIIRPRQPRETELQRQEREFQQRQARRHNEIEETDRQRSAIAAQAARQRRDSCDDARRRLAETSLRYMQQRRYYQDIASRDC